MTTQAFRRTGRTRGRSRERNRRHGAREVTGIIYDGRLTGRVSSIVIFPGVFANDSQNHSYPTSDAKEKHMAPKMLFTCGKMDAGFEGGATASSGDWRARNRAYSITHYNFLRRLFMLTSLSMMVRSSAIGTLFCSMVSRSRMVTQLSFSESWSTVTQNGVPMASWRR